MSGVEGLLTSYWLDAYFFVPFPAVRTTGTGLVTTVTGLVEEGIRASC